jgi:hypothetical protein
MEANEPAEMISGIDEERHHHESEKEKFRNYAAVWVAILAAAMAIRGVGAEQAKDEMIARNIQASDTWAQYQAKNMRQAMYKLAVDQLGQDLKTPGLGADVKAAAEKRLDGYQKTIKRYDSEPLKAGDPSSGGKKEISERARDYEKERDVLDVKNHNFNLAEMFYQLGLVLASVSILIASRRLLVGSVVLGLIGFVLTLNGFFLLVDGIG